MKEEISFETITMLNAVKNSLLLDSRNMQLFVVKDFTIESETTHDNGLFHNKTVTRNYLTSCKIVTYHTDAKFIGTLRDDSCKHMVILYDFYYMRDSWIKFREQLKAFGFGVSKIIDDKESLPSTPAELGANVFNELP